METDSPNYAKLTKNNVTQFLLEKATGVIYLLRVAATSRDYIHDEIARCGTVQCLKQALYKLIRRYASPGGLKSALDNARKDNILTIPPEKSGCGNLDAYVKALHRKIMLELTETNLKTWSDSGYSVSVEKGIEALLKEVEEAVREEGPGLLREVVVTLAILGFAPGRLPRVECRGDE